MDHSYGACTWCVSIKQIIYTHTIPSFYSVVSSSRSVASWFRSLHTATFPRQCHKSCYERICNFGPNMKELLLTILTFIRRIILVIIFTNEGNYKLSCFFVHPLFLSYLIINHFYAMIFVCTGADLRFHIRVCSLA